MSAAEEYAEAELARTKLQGRPFLSRAEILGADDQSGDTVEVPEWGGSVRVVSMTGADRAALEALTRRADGGEFVAGAEYEARIVAATVVDEHGKRLFTQDDVQPLMQRNGAVLARLAAAGARVSGMPIGADGLAELEAAAGN